MFFAGFQAWQDEHDQVKGQLTYFHADWSSNAHPNIPPIFKINAAPFWNVSFANVGSYLADKAYTVVDLESYDIPTSEIGSSQPPTTPEIESQLFDKMRKKLPSIDRRPVASFAPGDTSWSTGWYSHPLIQSEVDAFEGTASPRTKMMFVVGFSVWSDGSGRHEWPFCWLLVPHGTNQPTIMDCKSHNTFMPEAEE